MTIDQIIDDIIRREGGYVNHPADKGGPTKYGITLATLRAWRGTTVFQITSRHVEGLSEDTARDIYRTEYFIRPKISLLPSVLHPFMVDSAVNHGPRQAIKFLQGGMEVLVGSECVLLVDGVLGPKTLTAVSEVRSSGCSDSILLSYMILRRLRFYKALVTDSPSQNVFLAGWVNRLSEFIKPEYRAVFKLGQPMRSHWVIVPIANEPGEKAPCGLEYLGHHDGVRVFVCSNKDCCKVVKGAS